VVERQRAIQFDDGNPGLSGYKSNGANWLWN
jgi:hypothetical protein